MESLKKAKISDSLNNQQKALLALGISLSSFSTATACLFIFFYITEIIFFKIKMAI